MLKRFRGVLAGLGVLVLLAAGCGGDDDDPTSEERPNIEDGGEATSTPVDAVAAPTPTAVPAEIEVPRLTYTVQSGDLLGDIAATFGVPLGALISVNEMANPDLISIGQEIIIPTEEEVADWQAQQDAGGGAEPEPATDDGGAEAEPEPATDG